MKKDIHPEYYPDARITCACGAVYNVGSTKKEIRVEICSKCHPFYTGQRRIVDTGGRVERFVKKYGWGLPKPAAVEEPKVAKAKAKGKKGTEEVQEILKELEAEGK